MARLNFFCGVDALNCLLEMEFAGNYTDVELTLDLIEEPYFFIFTADSENWIVKAMNRGEIYNHDDDGLERGRIVVNKESEEGEIQAPESLAHNMGAVFVACRKIGYYLQDNKLDEVCKNFDPEKEGIMLCVEEGELKHKIVSGKERPNVMCARLLGGVFMGRPYMDEFMENSAREMMSIEEKIEAAQSGNISCMNDLAMLYLNGDDEIESDPEKAFYWFNKMAENGSSNGMFNLGLFFAKGYGVDRDFEKAAYWMKQASEAGDEDAEKLVKEYRLLAANKIKAEAGDAQAQAEFAAGLMRIAGSLEQAGREKEYAESVMWAQKAISKGNAEGIWVMGLAYEHGRGVEQNIDTAIDYYKKGAELGNAACMHNLGCEYMRGDNIEENQEKGFELIKASAEQGYGLAMRDLGYCYQIGNGCNENMMKAIEWYEKALEVIDDPELEQKVIVLKILVEEDPA